MPKQKTNDEKVRAAFSQAALKRVCEMHEDDFAEAYDMETWEVAQRAPDNFYYFKDNGASILAVAHLDTVMDHDRRTANFVNTAAGPVVYSGALDDRLGAYTILELLPKLGIKYDILLTVGEESGSSTAAFFDSPKEYNWMIEFDRGGTDVVMYQYDNSEMRGLVRKSGATPADGIFSDISYMEHLEIKGFNWGVGYRDYHGPRSHAYLNDYWKMISYYLDFHEENAGTYLPHEAQPQGQGGWWGRNTSYSGLWSSEPYEPAYKSPKGEQWWDSNTAGTGAEGDESDDWTDAQWDAYIEDGIEAARALAEPSDDDESGVEILFVPDMDDMVSDDFSEVNAALMDAQPELATMQAADDS